MGGGSSDGVPRAVRRRLGNVGICDQVSVFVYGAGGICDSSGSGRVGGDIQPGRVGGV